MPFMGGYSKLTVWWTTPARRGEAAPAPILDFKLARRYGMFALFTSLNFGLPGEPAFRINHGSHSSVVFCGGFQKNLQRPA
jgi:hypothetical protein